LLRLVEGGRSPVYCLFSNVFGLEDALRFGTGTGGLGFGRNEPGRLRGD
ncbi:unnamed protein product, partial [marine sediment metagenome]